MAWIEEHGGHYRVRYRRAGHIVTDSTHTQVEKTPPSTPPG